MLIRREADLARYTVPQPPGARSRRMNDMVRPLSPLYLTPITRPLSPRLTILTRACVLALPRWIYTTIS